MDDKWISVDVLDRMMDSDALKWRVVAVLLAGFAIFSIFAIEPVNATAWQREYSGRVYGVLLLLCASQFWSVGGRIAALHRVVKFRAVHGACTSCGCSGRDESRGGA